MLLSPEYLMRRRLRVGMQGPLREVQSVRGFTTFSRTAPPGALYSPHRHVPFHMLLMIEHIVAGKAPIVIVFGDPVVTRHPAA
jgi:hypothetical protein